MLTATHLSKSFGNVAAVRNVSLTLEPGRVLGLVGASGSGKSTLLNLLAGLLDADAGNVALDGQRVLGPAEVLVAGHPSIRLVHQEYQLMPNVSVAENILYPLRFFEKAYQQQRLAQLLRLCRLEKVAGRTPKQISGGEKQRVAIARAVADRPAVLLLDEPFSHLDGPNRLLIRKLLLDLIRHDGTAALFVTHESQDALALADQLGVMLGGRIVQLGPPADLYDRPLNRYVARMTGPVNIIPADKLALLNVAPAEIATCYALRPEHVVRTENSDGVAAVVQHVAFRGSHSEVDVAIGRLRLTMLSARPDVAPGQTLRVSISTKHLVPLRN